MAYDQVQAILGCVRNDPQCQASCQALAGQSVMSPAMIWDAAVCSASALPEPPTPLPEPPAMMGGGGGCGCATGGSGAVPVVVVVLGLGVLVVASRRRA
jgi:MYXO-CTERM domain-containing protein